jgi:hypothetical protein
VYEVFPRLWAERKNVQDLRLKELGRRAGERLVRQVLGDAVGSDTVERLVKQADGNAFYLEELIRAVAEGKDRSAPLPGTVLAMVETQVARIPLQARRVQTVGVARIVRELVVLAARREVDGHLLERRSFGRTPDSAARREADAMGVGSWPGSAATDWETRTWRSGRMWRWIRTSPGRS